MQQLTDPYRALGVARSATDAEIKAAHRKLAKRYHPDTGSKAETERFLRVQEAYRILADPLLRKEWDLKHAPGPVRADRPAAPPPRRRRPPAPKPEAEPAETSAPPRATRPDADPRTKPRSSRAYTWSASEVPWWEESGARADKRRSETRPEAEPEPGPGAEPEKAAPPADEPVFSQQDFDVYNRSSGAAWSMAARAYFRKGEEDLPRRGSFRHQGTQVVTAGRARSAAEADARRARTAAEAEARRRAAAAAAAAAVAGREATYAHATPPPAPGVGTTHIVRRSLPAPWPSLSQRFGFALIAWLPIGALVAMASQASGDELMGLVLTVSSLVLLIALPRIAYIAAFATALVGLIGGVFVGGILLAGSSPSLDRLSLYIGAMLVVGYIATAAVVVVGPSSLRPWSAR